MGGIGSAKGFKNNYNALAQVELVMRTFHDMTKPNLAIDMFGYQLKMPIMSAATGGVTYNMGNKMKDEEYINAIFGGCLDAGSLGIAADGIGDSLEVYQGRLNLLKTFGGKGMMTIKPKAQEEIIKRIRLIEATGALAFAIDIDSAGRAARALPGQIVEPKTAKQLEEIAKCTNLPFIIKGVMSADEAKIAVEVGAKGIVVSNHGGRVLDYTPATITVLPGIADAVRGKIKIFFDSGVRRGVDVLKALALGADCCLIGRPLVRGAHGGGREGVALMMNQFRAELMDAMVLTGTQDVRNVSRNIIAGGIAL
jgi:isopentenyl diphosphate isomerase/L-lactate dehydrogenase-like FMN-dependent dehydrogenase